MFIKAIEKTINQQLGETENGALGYLTSGDSFVNFNFRIPQYRNNPAQLVSDFAELLRDDPVLAMKMLFFLRDVRGGLGERASFRVLLEQIALDMPYAITKIMPLVPHYGRWDDLFVCIGTPAENEMIIFLRNQLVSDIENAVDNKPISLLAKWMPSINASSKETRALAQLFAKKMGFSHVVYRKILSTLRESLNVVERNLSAKTYENINYSEVPSQAHLRYKNTFLNKDGNRYGEYLALLAKNETKINAGTLAPYQIWHNYLSDDFWGYAPKKQLDATLEEMWKNLADTGVLNNTLVVADGSGSMTMNVGSTKVSALSVAQSLAVYFGERCQGQFQNTFITFSQNPRLIQFGSGTLQSKMRIVCNYSEVANTNIEKVFKLILDTALKNKMPQSELPETILIISDMEFDFATSYRFNKALFDNIADEFRKNGYLLPKLVFWNVNSRSGIIPMQLNELGVVLISGFNQSAIRAVMTGQLDPFLALQEVLNEERYKPVEIALQ